MTRSGEADVIAQSTAPVTRDDLITALSQAQISDGDIVIAHTAMSRLGWVVGGAQTVLDAVLTRIGETGTLVMPGNSAQLSDPRKWQAPPVPEDWIPAIMDTMPPFDLETTPTRGLGRVVEAFRAMPGTLRSTHPTTSFLARGPKAQEILADHTLSMCLGPNSPLGSLYALEAKVLFLGAGFDTATCFHLAEYDPGIRAVERVAYPVAKKDDRTIWMEVDDVDLDDTDFAEIGRAFEAQGHVMTALNGAVRSFSLRAAVEAARNWFSLHGGQS